MHADVIDAVEAIESDVQRAASLIHTVRQLYGPNAVTVTHTNVVELLRSALRRSAPVAARAGITMRASIEGPLWVDGDAVLLEQAVLNLLLNAIEATRALRGAGEVDVTARALPSTVRIAVTDNGPGFSSEALGQACEAFFTTKGPGNLGLGLALVCKVARAHGATLTIGNWERGARPVLSLPRILPQSPEAVCPDVEACAAVPRTTPVGDHK